MRAEPLLILKKIQSNFKFEKTSSGEATVTRMVNIILYALCVFEKESNLFIWSSSFIRSLYNCFILLTHFDMKVFFCVYSYKIWYENILLLSLVLCIYTDYAYVRNIILNIVIFSERALFHHYYYYTSIFSDFRSLFLSS